MKITTGKIEGMLALPIENGVHQTLLNYYADDKLVAARWFPLAQNSIDSWRYIPLSAFGASRCFCLEYEPAGERTAAIAFVHSRPLETDSTAVHYSSPYGKIEYISPCHEKNGVFSLECYCCALGCADGVYDMLCLESEDLLLWQERSLTIGAVLPEEANTGHSIFSVASEGEKSYLSLPAVNDGAMVGTHKNAEHLRVWERWFKDICGQAFEESLRFHVAPGVWPNIRVLPADGKPDDVDAPAFEIIMQIAAGKSDGMKMSLFGHKLSISGGTLSACGKAISVDCGSDMTMRVYVDGSCVEVFCGGQHLFAAVTPEHPGVSSVDTSVTGNIVGNVTQNGPNRLVTLDRSDGLCIRRLTVYGLRTVEPSDDAKMLLSSFLPDNAVFYDGGTYTVYGNRVSDSEYGKPDAMIINDETVVSPVRTIDEFVWRENQWGDMTRVINPTDVWRASSSKNAYPQITTQVTSVNAACNIALDIFALCSDRRYTLPGQEKMWAAGLFQGEGEGFGVWMRDSTHIALRSGNLLAPEIARRTLLYTVSKGFDNGCDGAAMAIVGLWDYYLATGDKTALFEAYPSLLNNISEAESRFSAELGLVRAEQSTSNDAFDEPENNGYCLATEIYFFKAYESMAKIGEVVGEKPEYIAHLKYRAHTMHEAINREYWLETEGCYCSGPRGSEAHSRVMYEASGTEAAIWSKFGIADQTKRLRTLEHMKAHFLSPYGIVTFPCREDRNHFCHSVWAVWTAGYADAASCAGDCELLHTLIGQLTRTSLINKTFYEVIDKDSGIAWRWPGQLWHAMGFISLFIYGVFGIHYDDDGMRFSPTPVKELGNCSLSGIRYANAVLDIELNIHAGRNAMLLDGRETQFIPRDISGSHNVMLFTEELSCQ